MPATDLQGETPKYPSEEQVAQWWIEAHDERHGSRWDMPSYVARKACDWQRERDALICERMYEAEPDTTDETFFSGLAKAKAAIRSGGSHD